MSLIAISGVSEYLCEWKVVVAHREESVGVIGILSIEVGPGRSAGRGELTCGVLEDDALLGPLFQMGSRHFWISVK